MSSRFALAFALSAVLLSACSSTSPKQMKLLVSSEPAGAHVYFSRRGEKAVQAKAGFIKGDIKAEEISEDFVPLGTAPLVYKTPLQETESNASVLGFGGEVVLEYKEGILRFEMPGFETVERHVRFKNGEVKIQVTLPSKTEPGTGLD